MDINFSPELQLAGTGLVVINQRNVCLRFLRFMYLNHHMFSDKHLVYNYIYIYKLKRQFIVKLLVMSCYGHVITKRLNIENN